MDNEASNEAEEQDIIDLLAMQGEEEGNEEGEIDTDTDDIDILRERVSKRNKALKKSKQANHRMQDELADLKTMVENMRDNPNQAPDTGAQRQEQKEAFEQWRDSVADKPENALDYTNAVVGDLKSTMADLLSAQQESFDARLAELRDASDPEKNKYRDKIDRMKANPQYADIPEEHLLKFVKGAEKLPRGGSIGGKRAKADIDPDKRLEDIKARYKTQYGNG